MTYRQVPTQQVQTRRWSQQKTQKETRVHDLRQFHAMRTITPLPCPCLRGKLNANRAQPHPLLSGRLVSVPYHMD